MNLSLLFFWACLSMTLTMAFEHFQPIQRITSFPIRDTSYMGPFRNTLEEKVQLLMKQRRKSSLASSNEANNAHTKLKTLVPRSVITDLAAKRRVMVEPVSENYNELFLDLNQMSVKPKKKLNHLALKVPSSSLIKPLNAKKPSQTSELAGKSQSEYFQSDSFKKNKSRQNNPLRLKRIQLLHDQNFLEKHQKLGNFIFSKNKDNLDLIAMATTTVATTTSNQIQTNRQSNKKNKKLNDAISDEKSTTFQNRLPNLRDSSSESLNTDVIFNAKEKLEDLNRNETKSLEDETEDLKSKSEFETQSILLNDDENNTAKKRFRDSSKKTSNENEKSNTLSMQRHYNPNQQQSNHHHHKVHHHQNQQIHHFQPNRNDFFKPLSLKKAPTNPDHPLRPNNYFQAKERLLSTQGPNSEYYKPSNYYQHNKVSNFNEVERTNQPQGPLPSGFHFKLLKSKRPTQTVNVANTEAVNVLKAQADKVNGESNQVEVVIPGNVNEDKLAEKVEEIIAKEADIDVVKEPIGINEPIKEELIQNKEVPLSEEVMINKQDEPSLIDLKSEVQKEELDSVNELESKGSSSRETIKELEKITE